MVWATSSVLILFCFAGGLKTCSAQNLITLEFEAKSKTDPAVQLIGLEYIEDEEPLDRLKQRSPEDRWNKVRDDALSIKSAPLETKSKSSTETQLPELKGVEEFQPFTLQQNPQRRETEAGNLPALPNLDSIIESTIPTYSQTRTEQQSPESRQPAPLNPADSVPLVPPVPEAGEIESQPESFGRGDNNGPLRPLGQIKPYYDYESIRASLLEDVDTDRVPEDVAVSEIPSETLAPRLSPDTVFSWEASNLWHNPLYFEDPSLERYGHVAPQILQPLISTSRLGVQLFGLPYQMSIDPIRQRRYTLGWYRPGEEVPHLFYLPPWNLKAAAVEAGAVSAGVVILP